MDVSKLQTELGDIGTVHSLGDNAIVLSFRGRQVPNRAWLAELVARLNGAIVADVQVGIAEVVVIDATPEHAECDDPHCHHHHRR